MQTFINFLRNKTKFINFTDNWVTKKEKNESFWVFNKRKDATMYWNTEISHIKNMFREAILVADNSKVRRSRNKITKKLRSHFSFVLE